MSEKYFVHKSSYIDDGAVIGENTKIWHFCHIQREAKIGKNCVLGQNVNIGPKVEIGDGVKIQNNVSVYEGVVIERDAFIGPSVVFTNVLLPRSKFPKRHYARTVIKRGATIGANATILCGITIGKYALIGAGAVVTEDVLAYSVVRGNPAKPCGYVNEKGEKCESL